MFRNTPSLLGLLSAAILVSLLLPEPRTAVGQGLLVGSGRDSAFRLPRPNPRPGEPGVIYDIAKLEIDASIRGQVAEIQVGQTFKNRSSQTLQVQFVFPLPYDGAIDQMTFLVDGEELEGRLLKADEAREIYQSYVRRSRDPALVQWIGTGMFQTQVFPVPPGAERTVSIRYTQLCRRSGNLNDWTLPLAPARFTSRPIGTVSIRGRIRSDAKLGNVYSPSHELEVDRDGDRVARFEFKAKNLIPRNDFRVLWDSGTDQVQMSVIAHRPSEDEDGYFMLMLQPQMPDPPPQSKKAGKNLIMVLDKSGSMRGEKIEQTRRAARDIVRKLKGRDRFTLITYDSKVETYSSELTKADKETRYDATEYVDTILAGGSTNIDEALRDAFQLAGDADGPTYVVFMTDGQPTVGEKNSMKIAANAQRELNAGTRLFSLGVGHDVNSRLLDKLASICLGQTSYIRPGRPIDEAIASLWERIGAPALTDARLTMRVDGKEGRIRQLYPSEMYDLFSGDQVVVVGRYRKGGDLSVRLTGDYLGKQLEFDLDDELPARTGSGKNVFVERLWATRRIGQIIDDIDLHGENEELVDELVALSKKHGILTPYTAYLAEERTDLNNRGQIRQAASDRLQSLDRESGRFAFEQRSMKGTLKLAERAAPAEFYGDDSLAASPVDSFGLSAPAGQAPASGNRPGSRRSRGRGLGMADEMQMSGGFGGRGGGADGATMLGGMLEGEVLGEARASRQPNVKRIGAKTFFLKRGRYIDADASDKQIADAIEIEQFSDDYFKLVRQLDDVEKAYLAEDQEILVVLKGKSYLITAASEQTSTKP